MFYTVYSTAQPIYLTQIVMSHCLHAFSTHNHEQFAYHWSINRYFYFILCIICDICFSTADMIIFKNVLFIFLLYYVYTYE